jgi:hypothetical protein
MTLPRPNVLSLLRVAPLLVLTPLVVGGCDSSPAAPPAPVVASVTVEPAAPGISAGQTVQLTATARAADGAVIAGRTFSWQSQNESVASVSATGLVTGVQAGSAVVTASTDGRTGQATVAVTPVSAVTISSVAPALLQAGVQATIAGEGFSPTPGGNTVTIGGAPAQVVAATATSLTVTVPPGVCRPTGDVVVRVAAAGGSGERLHPWQAGAALQVGVGQQVRLDPAATYCIQVAAGSGTSSFLIGVQSISELATALTPARVELALPGSPPPATAAAFAAPASVFAAGSGAALPASAAAVRRAGHRTDELRQRARDLAFLAARPPRAAGELRSLAQHAATASVPGSVVPGDTVNVKYPRTPNSCTSFTPLRAVVRRVGTHGIWVEDVANPTGGFSAAHYELLGSQFDDKIAATNIAYFGEPTDFDGNGRIVIVITQEINKEELALGRVYSADFFPDDCPSSNGGEYFYGIAPDPTGSAGEAYSVSDALLDMPFIIAHEMAHVIQFGRRLTTPGATGWQSIWELEGQATLAEEVVGHAISGNQPGQNYGFAVAWNTPTQQAPVWYIGGFIDLALYFGFGTQTTAIPDAPEQCGWLDVPVDGSLGPCQGRRSLYGVSWSFLRWISDQYGPSYPGGEQGLQRALVQDTRSGFTTISRVVGEPIDLLLARWSAALYMDDRQQGVHPSLTFTSWNLADIFNRLVEPARLRPRQRSFTPSSDAVSVRAGSTAYFRLTGTSHSAGALSVTGTAGAALPPHMRVWIVRLQ